MTTGIYSDAALLTDKTQFRDVLNNPLSADDLPFEDRGFVGWREPLFVIEDDAAPGVANCELRIGHLVAERANSETINANDERRSETHNGYVYKAQNGGTTDSAPPTWPTTIGQTVNDNGVIWECVRRTLEPENMRLALTQGDLSSATWGANLDLGVLAIPSEPINAIEVWIEINTAVTLVTSVELYISVEHLALRAA